MLELSELGFGIAMVTMKRILIQKVDKKQQMDTPIHNRWVSRETEILRQQKQNKT